MQNRAKSLRSSSFELDNKRKIITNKNIELIDQSGLCPLLGWITRSSLFTEKWNDIYM